MHTPSRPVGFAAAIGSLALVAAALPATSAFAAPADLVINEFYGRGGSANQPYTHKFIELHNPTDEEISLEGVQAAYWSSGRTVDDQVTTCDLSGTVAAGGYFVVSLGSNGDTGSAVPADAECGNIQPSGSNGAVGVITADGPLDTVGYGSPTVREGAPASYTGDNSTPGSIGRTNGVDTDDNAADFTFFDDVTPGAVNPGGSPSDPQDPAPAEEKPIAEIQGPGEASPIDGAQVTTQGVVTAVYGTGGFDGIYIQTPGTGGEAKGEGDASDGIFVYRPQDLDKLAIGDCVDVTGTVSEHYSMTQISETTSVSPVDDCAPVTATPLPAWPTTDAERERYEGMLVTPEGTYTITNNYQVNQYGSLGLAYGEEPLHQATDKVRPGPEAEAYEKENLTKAVTLDDGSSWDYMRNDTAKASPLPYLGVGDGNTMRTGAHVEFTGEVILDYRYDQWNFQPTAQQVGPQADFIAVEDTRSGAPAVEGDVTLASFNVLNYFTDLGQDEPDCEAHTDRNGTPVASDYCTVRGAYTPEAFADQQTKIVAAINELDADVVGLMEVEDTYNVPQSPGFKTDPDRALKALVQALNDAAGTEKWAAAPSPAVWTNTDAIRTGFIYQKDSVTPSGAPQMLADPAFANARHPIAQTFARVDRPDDSFVAIVNHFKSKGSGDDDGTGQGKSNPSRVAQAQALNAWVSGNGDFADQPVLLLGDFNAYTMEDPLKTLEDEGWTNVPKAVGADDASYQFSGRLGSLDHIFGNQQAMDLVTATGGTKAAVWNINGDESVAYQYSRRNYNATDFHEDNAFASSDHDPVKVGLSWVDQPTLAPVTDDNKQFWGTGDLTIEYPILNPDAVDIDRCEATTLPAGMTVSLTPDQSACVLQGTPSEPFAGDLGLTIVTTSEETAPKTDASTQPLLILLPVTVDEATVTAKAGDQIDVTLPINDPNRTFEGFQDAVTLDSITADLPDGLVASFDQDAAGDPVLRITGSIDAPLAETRFPISIAHHGDVDGHGRLDNTTDTAVTVTVEGPADGAPDDAADDPVGEGETDGDADGQDEGAGTEPGNDPGTEPGHDPGTEPGHDPESDDPADATEPRAPEPGTGGKRLPSTGASDLGGALVLGLIAVAGGAAVVRKRS